MIAEWNPSPDGRGCREAAGEGFHIETKIKIPGGLY